MAATTSDRDWRKWGETDPYFGVVSFPEYKADRIVETAPRFFETGRREVHTTLTTIARLYGDIDTVRALDFGSGVGRLAMPLARRFERVVGVDISDAMNAEARRNCAQAGILNAEFVPSDAGLTQVSGSFDLVHSYIVLQHIPVERGLALTGDLLDRLKPGGVAALHYSTQRTLGPAKALAYALKHEVPFARGFVNWLQGRSWGAPAMAMHHYPLRRIVEAFESRGLGEIVCVPEWHSAALTVRVYGRKGSATVTA